MPVSPTRVKEIFTLLSSTDPDTRSKFFTDHVAESVRWTIIGSTPMSGVYHSRSDFLAATIETLGNQVLTEPLRIGVKNSVTMPAEDGKGTWATVEMRSIDATCRDGMTYDMRYCWVARFGAGEVMEEVTAYLDTDLLIRAIKQNPKQ